MIKLKLKNKKLEECSLETRKWLNKVEKLLDKELKEKFKKLNTSIYKKFQSDMLVCGYHIEKVIK